MNSHHDPLLELEKRAFRPTLFVSIGRTLKFLTVYVILSGTIFGVLLGALNYSAYSTRIMNWIDPTTLITARDEVANLLSSTSIQVHASESAIQERKEDLASITEKILTSDPSMVYAKNYEAKGLLGGIKDINNHKASFEVAPYENRMIIPRIGKNIPLVDVEMRDGIGFDTMHEIFMEELKKGIVRYPGTSRPGEVGNAFFFGHSSNYPWVKSDYNDIFALLDQLQNGDEITVYYFQKKYVYKVTDRATVKPGDVKTLESRDHTKKELSLMTCWPIGTTLERLIIFAELVEKP